MKISREVKTAVLVISGIVMFIFLYNYLKGENLFDTSDIYYTEFDYNALTKSSLITVKGNTVGKIKDIIYDYKTGKTRVAFSVNEELKFSKKSIVRLYETGLMGGNALAIVVSNEGELAKPGDILVSEVEVGLVSSLSENFSGLSGNLDTTLKSADSLLMSLNTLVKDDSEEGIKNAITEMNATIKSFKNVSYSFNSLIAKNDEKLTSVLTNFEAITKDLAVVTSDLKDIKISETITDLDKTLASVNTLMADIENGNGSIGKLLKDESLYNNLEGASKQLEQLLEDIKLNPKRYMHFSLFGKKAKQYDAEGIEIEN